MEQEGIAFETGVNIGKDIAAKVSGSWPVPDVRVGLHPIVVSGTFGQARRGGAVHRSHRSSRLGHCRPRVGRNTPGGLFPGNVAKESNQAEQAAGFHSQRQRRHHSRLVA